MHPDSICTRDNPKKATKKGRRPGVRRHLAKITRARVRDSSDMRRTFNATDTRETGYSRQRNARFPSQPLTIWDICYQAGPARPLNKKTCSPLSAGGTQIVD